MKVKLICIFGPPASGKNTIGRLLLKQIPNAHFLHNHALVDVVTELFDFKTTAAKNSIFALRKHLLQSFIDVGEGVLITTQVLDRNSKQYMVLYRNLFQQIKKSGNTSVILDLHASKESLLKRSCNDDRRKYRNVSKDDVQEYINRNYRLWNCDYQKEFLDSNVFSVDTDQFNAESVVFTIMKELEKL
ncbi:hypothetical protein IPN35_01590 [Candidatus Peregrinibacteria bacterium]|nr:MAG: hypothetical protein IPN35_01590 [Candidatus Peregrinibacteria bacterium]